MKLLLDTHFLMWVSGRPDKLSTAALGVIQDPANELIFSVASIWEVAIKDRLRRADFRADPGVLRRNLLDNGYVELPILASHALTVAKLPLVHRDPFDRILLAQAIAEGFVLLTADAIVARYPASVLLM